MDGSNTNLLRTLEIRFGGSIEFCRIDVTPDPLLTQTFSLTQALALAFVVVVVW